MHIYIDTDRLICVLMHLSYDMDVDWLVSLNQKFKWFSIFILLQFYLHKLFSFGKGSLFFIQKMVNVYDTKFSSDKMVIKNVQK
jgi:hypothetical protein